MDEQRLGGALRGFLIPSVVLAACGGPPGSTQTRVDAGARTSSTAFFELPSHPLTNVEASERIAFDLQKLTSGAICGRLRAIDLAGLHALLGDGFRARLPDRVQLTGEEPGRVQVTTGDLSAGADEGGPELLDRWISGLLLDTGAVERCAFKPYEVYAAQDGATAHARLDLSLGGKRTGGAPFEHTAKVEARFSRAGPAGWRLDRLQAVHTETTRYTGATFADVSRLAGIGLHRSREKQELILRDLGNVGITTLGGVTILDWNHDGLLDILVYELESELELFQNDGAGGYTRIDRARLIPAAEAAPFYLYLDLDGDGVEELIGSRPKRCAGGKATLPIYRVERGRLVEARRGIEYPSECHDRFHHIAPFDLDGDGRLDLYFSNYGDSKRPLGHNLVDAQDGGPNHLFMNGGGLRFTDESAARGLDGATRRTHAADWFDYDEDGRPDLVIVNDFAPNEVYRNAGGGKLVKAQVPPLTENGFSMGISAGDLDRDGHLDLYVSKMYSYAGNRVLAISPDVAPERRAMLVQMAQGNALYRGLGGGRFEERAGPLKIANAQWAWGNQLFDVDNDGDTDLFVTTGYNTNPDAAAADAPDN